MKLPTTSKLRDDIDKGRTGDKVDHPDPSAAPLGTDDEAAGTPVPARAAAEAVGNERSVPPDASRVRSTIGERPLLLWMLIVLGAAVIAASAFLASGAGANAVR